LDELPQLVNVLKGEMSMIGPRAEWIKCTEIYELELPFYHYRHLVRPGITGWAQVCFGYGEGKDDAMEKLRYDLYYVRHCSLVLDLTIILKTIQIMASARGR
jgi:lipopolysaccharide/colanic/teichoic acid biosynthesis glycosyltransferase